MKAETIKKLYPSGTRILLNYMNDCRPIPPGTKGTVTSVDDMGTIHCQWDNGGTLGLIYGEDDFEIIEQ